LQIVKRNNQSFERLVSFIAIVWLRLVYKLIAVRKYFVRYVIHKATASNDESARFNKTTSLSVCTGAVDHLSFYIMTVFFRVPFILLKVNVEILYFRGRSQGLPRGRNISSSIKGRIVHPLNLPLRRNIIP